MMKTKHFLAAGLLCISNAAFCTNATAPNHQALADALGKHLAQRGNVCLAKYDWPIDVSAPDFEMGTRDAVQMPVLEKLGLVVSSDGTVSRMNGEDEIEVQAKRYTLTDAGKKFYLKTEISSTTPSGKKIEHHGDFCAGKLSLDKLVRWDKPTAVGGSRETTVTYTYKFAAAEWTLDPEIQKAFPMVNRLLKGERTLELQQRFRLSNKSWLAVNL